LIIDGLSPARVLQPASIEELSETMASTGSVVAVGAGTQQYFGNPLRRFDSAIDLTRLNRITEYVPADLTIHLEAGVTLQTLAKTLADNNQFVPLDPWNGSSATIGGIAASNAQGPFRASGTIRDWIIGMKVVEANGRVSKTGGRVVKNVTGYDLAKLYTGSIGSLAIIAEVSLKVRAKYGATATAIAQFATADKVQQALGAIQTGPLQPVSCEWVGPQHELWLRFGEHPKAVDWQLRNLPPADWKVIEAADEASAWESLRVRYGKLGPIVLKVVGLPSTMPELLKECRPSSWIAHAANGVVSLSVSSAEDVARIRKSYRAVIERAPLDLRRQVATFGLNDAEYELMRRMKISFDPEGRLNPGRHVDGERTGNA
jgi:glycolate dehydrogenase FAD-binding subunit